MFIGFCFLQPTKAIINLMRTADIISLLPLLKVIPQGTHLIL